MELAELRRATFEQQADRRFTLDTGPQGPRIELRLASVGAAGAGLPGKREPFSLVFEGPLSPILAQQTYRLAHSALGVLDVFLVPIGPQGGAMQYEAVFS